MALADLIQYDPNILQRKLAQELAQASGEQALQQRAFANQLAQQLAPLQQQEQALQVQALQQQLDPAFQQQAFAQKLQQAVALQQATQQAKLEAFGEYAPGTLIGTPEQVMAGKGFQVPSRLASTQFVGTGVGEGGIPVGTIYDPNTQTFKTAPLPPQFQTKTSRSSSAKGGLTENAKANIIGRASKAGVLQVDTDLDKFKNDLGEIDFQKLSIASGRGERETLDSAREAKLNQIPAEARNKVAAYQAVQKDLERLRERLDQEQASGDIPSGMQDIISASLSEPPGNFFSRTFQRFVLQPAQSKTAAENERLRGAVSASIGRAIAGAALTGTEKENLIPFSPQPGDSFERLLDKASSLEQFLNNQIEGLTSPIPIGGAQPTPGGQAQRQEAIKWLEANPTDPRALKIRQRLGL